ALNDGGRWTPSGGWTLTPFAGPSPRIGHSAVWTGSEMVVWGGAGGDYLDDGGRWTPSGGWTLTPSAGPWPRMAHSAVWTGSEMVVWGGAAGGAYSNDGMAYVPP
ncbi:MAG: galactose oxidase, partial [Myxococcota bacterium]